MEEGKVKSPPISGSDIYRTYKDGVELAEFDTKSLKQNEMKDLLNRLVKIPEKDNEGFLLKLKQRMDRVGLKVPTIEVRFQHLNVTAEAYVGSRALPTIQNSCANMLEGFLSYLRIIPTPKKPLPILQDVSGIIKPGRMVLLLGPPTSGKTTLLLALAGKLGSDLQVSGRVTYNGCDLNEFVPQRTSSYISQYDNHMGEMTVRETLDFSARCQGVGSRHDMLVELSKREEEESIKADPDIEMYMKATSLEGQDVSLLTEYTLKILGLEDCADTVVGNEMIRGISGGEKKRLTAGEMMVGPVTSRKDQEQYWMNKDDTYSFVSAKEFAERFRSFHVGAELGNDLVFPFDKSKGHPLALTTKKYGASKKDIFKSCISREYLLMKRTSFIFIFQIIQIIFMLEEFSGIFSCSFVFIKWPQHLLALGGFVLSKDNIHPWWIWGYWTSPLMYAQNAIAVNEFLGKSWRHVLPNSTEPLGVTILKTRGLIPDAYWYWLGIGALVGFMFFFNFLSATALAFFNPIAKPQAILSEETLAERSSLAKGNDFGRSISSSAMSASASNINLTSQKKHGMVLPFQPLSICFNDIKYAVDVSQELKARAWLRLPPDVDNASKKMFVEEVMELVELTPLKGALVGLPGLDARAAAIVMRTVRNTVDTGRTVVCTIHQPSIDIFDAFDELILLESGGEEIYVGPVGHQSSDLIDYFEAINGVPKIKDGYNPATWMLDVTSKGHEETLEVKFAEVYKKSELYRRNKESIEAFSIPVPDSQDIHFATQISFRDYILECWSSEGNKTKPLRLNGLHCSASLT
ncbi:hypothetical protein POM88_001490 [Heracleum sosnowskyi]|uniref:Uncharacterized protein n=1 Tax=Heracleum sosnowskyi TaxID=360622 RepID=A0AAD8JC88_9APIA|nr:hypothetical protein POM88_001490 [Heracleum sosnowskyi]